MTDRITSIVLGMQRLTEETQIRGKDIRHVQAQQDSEHLKDLQELLVMVQRLHSALIDDIREFSPRPVIQEVPQQGLGVNQSAGQISRALKPDSVEPMPNFIKQGPRKEAQ